MLRKCFSNGPIIEQSTHLCDLSRYFGGEVDISTVLAHSLEWYEEAGKLSKIQIDEDKIEPENRSPRATVATWLAYSIRYSGTTDYLMAYRKYENGAVGTLSHLLVLHGTEYSCEVEVYADGYQMK